MPRSNFDTIHGFLLGADVRDTQALAALQSMDFELATLRAQVDELSMLIRMLVHSVRKTNPDNETAMRAMDYLQRHGLQGSLLRDEAEYGAGDCVPTDC